MKALVSEGIIEEDSLKLIRRGLAVRNAIAHGFINQPVAPVLLAELRALASALLKEHVSAPV